ncbi:MAG: TIR domain-containing protein [Lachnospiraceae bacterium]|nr:TIR domain-containing protein [Lachnospiraceae bacterium]
MEELQSVHYDAFISYRHSELDSFVAENLHKRLEAFKLPKSARAKAKSDKTRISRVFRDVEELPLSDNLSDPINNALANSEFLITICTPRYPQSKWCMKEIEVFLQTHDREHVLVVLAEDEPENSFPEILNFEQVEVVGEDGEVSFVKKPIEPLAADTRGENKKEILKAMDTAVIKLCAAIFGMNYDDLKQRHREQKIKRMAALFGSIGAAILLFAVFATVMLIRISKANATISRQYEEIQDKYAGSVATASEQLLGAGRKKDAIYAVKSVLPDSSLDKHNNRALSMLYSSMGVYDTEGKYTALNAYDMASEVVSYNVSFDNKYILINDWITIGIFDIESGKKIKDIEKSDASGEIIQGVFCGDEGILKSEDAGIYYCPISGGEEKLLDIGLYAEFLESPDGKITVVYSDDHIYGIDNFGNIAYDIDLYELYGASFLIFSDISFDDGCFAMSLGDTKRHYMVVADEMTGEVKVSFWNNGGYMPYVCLGGSTLYFSLPGYGENGNVNSTVYAVDINSGTTWWKTNLPDFSTMDILTVGDHVYLYDYVMVMVLKANNGGAINYYRSDHVILEGWEEDGAYNYLSQEGKVYYCDENTTYDKTLSCFDVAPAEYMVNATYQNGELFCLFNGANYITRYASYENKAAELTDGDYEFMMYSENSAETALGLDTALLDEAFYSDDNKLIFASFTNHVGKVYDAVSLECLKSFDVEYTHFNKLAFSELTGGYILSGDYYSYLMDDDYDIYCSMSRIVDEKDGCFIIRNMEDKYYKVPFVGYEELMDMAGKRLGDYEPAEDIKQKYNIK